MLVLTRKRHEQIHIGDNITLTILKIKGNSVSVGIEAPREVRVLRSELPQRQPVSSPSIDLEASASSVEQATEGLHRRVKQVGQNRINGQRIGVAV